MNPQIHTNELMHQRYKDALSGSSWIPLVTITFSTHSIVDNLNLDRSVSRISRIRSRSPKAHTPEMSAVHKFHTNPLDYELPKLFQEIESTCPDAVNQERWYLLTVSSIFPLNSKYMLTSRNRSALLSGAIKDNIVAFCMTICSGRIDMLLLNRDKL